MVPPFRSLMANLVEPAVDGLFAERFLFVPMHRPPQGRAAADPQREAREIIAVLDWDAPEGHSASAGLSGVGAVSAPPVLSVDVKYFPTPADHPRQDDRFESIENGDVFEVAQVRPDGVSRIEFDLVSRGRQPPPPPDPEA